MKGVGQSDQQNFCDGHTQKAVFHRACENAFSHVAIILLPQGVVVNVTTTIQSDTPS